MSSEKWDAIFEMAREEKALDAESITLLLGAIEERDTNDAREILARAADCLEEGKPLSRLVSLYLAYSLRSIALGQDPTQALHLKKNAKSKTSQQELMELFFAVEWHMRNGAPSQKEAIRRAATQLGLKPPAAEKRFQIANASAGEVFRILSGNMRALSQRIPSLGDALSGAAAPSEADKVIAALVDLVGNPRWRVGRGAPKEGA